MRIVGIVFMLVFSIFLTWNAGPFALGGWVSAYESVRERSYAETQGVLTESRLQDGYWTVRYAYEVDGQRYESDVAYDALSAFGGQAGEDQALALAHPAGAAVTVHYDPRHPERAVLDPVTYGSEALFWPLSITLAAFIAMAWGSLLSLLMWQRREIAVGACLVSTGPNGATHVRMPAMSPIHLAMVLAMFVPFVSIFVVIFASAFLAGGVVTPEVVFVDIAAVFAIIIGFPVRLWLRRKDGAHDLVIDSSTVSLPAMHGRKQVTMRKRSEISGVRVDESRGSRGASRFLVSLSFSTASAEQIAEYSADWERAEALANWLGAKLGKPVTFSWTLAASDQAA